MASSPPSIATTSPKPSPTIAKPSRPRRSKPKMPQTEPCGDRAMPLALAEERADALTRDEHLAWCKRRALEHVAAGDLTHAVASMASDLKMHPDTDNPALSGLAMIGMMYVTDGDKAAVQRWIERFR